MSETTPKSKTIGQILKLTKSDPTKYFDKLSDKPDEYLVKLLKVVKGLK
jgi:hypothetical protein